jgi:hypothetical protein
MSASPGGFLGFFQILAMQPALGSFCAQVEHDFVLASKYTAFPPGKKSTPATAVNDVQCRRRPALLLIALQILILLIELFPFPQINPFWIDFLWSHLRDAGF